MFQREKAAKNNKRNFYKPEIVRPNFNSSARFISAALHHGLDGIGGRVCIRLIVSVRYPIAGNAAAIIDT